MLAPKKAERNFGMSLWQPIPPNFCSTLNVIQHLIQLFLSLRSLSSVGVFFGDAIHSYFLFSPFPLLSSFLSLREFLALKHESRILGHSSNPVCGFFMMEQVRLCAVWSMENWLGSSLLQIKGFFEAIEAGFSRL